MRVDRSQSLSIGDWLLRAVLVTSLAALAWWAAWVLDPRDLRGPVILFALVVAGQALDVFTVLGFWHAIWPRRRSRPPFAPVRGRGSLLVLTRDEPVQVVEQTLKAALDVRRRHRVFLADPFERPELGWLAGWYGVRRLSPEMEELDGIAAARFLAIIEAGQVPRPEFLERLLPYFADRSLALVQAWCSRRGGSRGRVRDAVLRGGQALGRPTCLGTNYVLRRSALHSVGGFGPGATSPAGALRLAAALRAEQWASRYVGERLTDGLGARGPVARLAEGSRQAAARLASLLPVRRRRGASPGQVFHSVWAAMRFPALVGLPLSALALATYATLEPLPLGWARNLAVHLVPYLAMRAAVRLVVAVRRPQDLPSLRPEAAAGAEAEGRPEAPPPPVREPMPPLQAAPGAAVVRLPWDAAAGPEPEPVPDPPPAPRPRALRAAVAIAAAWIVTTGAIGAVAFAVIRSNPPQGPAQVQGGGTPTYSYYAPVQPP